MVVVVVGGGGGAPSYSAHHACVQNVGARTRAGCGTRPVSRLCIDIRACLDPDYSLL